MRHSWTRSHYHYEWLSSSWYANCSTSKPSSESVQTPHPFFPRRNPRVTRVVNNNDKDVHLPPMERTREGPTISIWSNCLGFLVITVLTGELEAAIILPWRQGAQTRLLSNLSKGNPWSRSKPLSQHNKSKLRWPNLLCHFQSPEEDWESKHLKEDWANEKSSWKTFSIQETPQTQESDLWKSTLKSASTSWETESMLYLIISTRVTLFKVRKSFTSMTPLPSTLPFLSSP
jgi:hypothetical protein